MPGGQLTIMVKILICINAYIPNTNKIQITIYDINKIILTNIC